MGKPSRRASRRMRHDRRPEPRKRTGIWLWSALALGVVVTGLAIETGLDQGVAEEIVGQGPSDSDEVLAYVPETASWEPAVVKDLGRGQEFQYDGRFYRIDKHGVIRMSPHAPSPPLPPRIGCSRGRASAIPWQPTSSGS